MASRNTTPQSAAPDRRAVADPNAATVVGAVACGLAGAILLSLVGSAAI